MSTMKNLNQGWTPGVEFNAVRQKTAVTPRLLGFFRAVAAIACAAPVAMLGTLLLEMGS
jgi:hypothetical protein